MAMRKVGAKAKVSGTKKKTTRRKKRRISGTADMTGLLENAAGLVVGSVGARELNTLGAKMAPAIFTPMISALVQIGVGFILPKFIKGSFVQAIGNGMIANGGMVLVVSTGIINGLPSSQGMSTYRIAGTSNLPAVAGTSNLPAVAGNLSRVKNLPPGQPNKFPVLSY